MDIFAPPVSLSHCIVLKDPWCSMILSGKKSTELRHTAYHKELIGKAVGIAKSKTGKVFGHAILKNIIQNVPAALMWSPAWIKKHV